ncbi:hypothetical protein [Bifidobacterium mongoliense]|uniref:hypothetical protein n=1 Tax=Bifidobacterium mongoliense TaxID=518643 RepID=UPI0030EF332A
MSRPSTFKALQQSFHDFEHHHPVLLVFGYIGAAIVLILFLAVFGVIPGLHPHPEATPVASSSTAPSSAPSTSSPAVDDGDWKNASTQLAQQKLDGMQQLLSSPSGIDKRPIHDFIFAYGWPLSVDYQPVEDAFTDTTKQVFAAPGTNKEQVQQQCDKLNQTYDAWQKAAWVVANKSIARTINDWTETSKAARTFLQTQPSYPKSCLDFAAYYPDKTVGTTKQDFTSRVDQYNKANNLLTTCGTQLTPDQAANMPQDVEQGQTS